MEEIQNKVAQSGIITFNLEEYLEGVNIVELDIKPQLYMGLMLKEKEFREYIKTNDWQQYKDAHVAVFCSSDAIVPTWAYMLIANKLSGIAAEVVFGNKEALLNKLFEKKLAVLDVSEFKDQRVVIKGCSDKPVPIDAYVSITNKLTPVVKSLMFGEPCSTVPIYKKS